MEGSPGVLYPGEIERNCELERRAHGIDVEKATWNRLREVAESLGAELDFSV